MTFELTKLDVLDGLDELKICTGYKLGDKVVELLPMDAELKTYLQVRAAGANVDLARLLDDDAVDAIRDRLTRRDAATKKAISMCYPLVVNNLVCRALNAAAAVGFPKVDAQVIAGC